MPAENRMSSPVRFLDDHLLYAIGEIILVVIRILTPLPINKWNQCHKENRLSEFYLKSLVNNLVNDTLDLNRFVSWQKKDRYTQKNHNRMYDPSSNIDTIIQIAKN